MEHGHTRGFSRTQTARAGTGPASAPFRGGFNVACVESGQAGGVQVPGARGLEPELGETDLVTVSVTHGDLGHRTGGVGSGQPGDFAHS